MNLESIRHTLHRVGLDSAPRTTNERTRRADESAATASESPTLADLRRYLAAAQATPAIREERVTALRAAIAQGAYLVPVDLLAQRLLGDGQ